MHLDREDILWLAGLLEGEGSFDLHRQRYPRIRLGMSDRDVVGRAATLMGARVRLSLQPAPRAAMWHTEISGSRALIIMELILPFMGARRSAKIASIIGHSTLAVSSHGAPGPRIPLPA